MLLTARELAREISLSRDQVYRLARGGAIPAHKIGHEWRFSLGEVMELTINGQPETTLVQPAVPRMPHD